MSSYLGPNTITDGLVLSLDAANTKSFRGEPTTNLSYNNGQPGSEYLAMQYYWVNSGAVNTNTNETDVSKPAEYDSPEYRIISMTITTPGSIMVGCGYTSVNPSTTYTMSVYVRLSTAGVYQTSPYLRTVETGGGWKDLINSNNADLSNMTYDSTGMYYNGTSSYFQMDQILTTPITINCFLKYTNQSKPYNTWFNSSPHAVLGISSNRLAGGEIYIYIGNGTGWLAAPSIISSITVMANIWHCLTFVSNGSGSILYLNGVNVGTSEYSPSGWGSYYHIGRIVQSGEFLKGYINNLQIYNRALSQPEVQQNYNALKRRFGL